MHNGCINDLAKIKRDLVMAVDPSLYTEIKGSTDTEILFYLALTLGLEDDPAEAISRTIGLVEALGHARGIEFPFQGTIATSDGESLWAFRYSTEGKSRTLFVSRDVHTLRHLYPEREILNQLSENARLIVSEPIGDLPGAWVEVPESSWGVVGPDREEIHQLTIKPPTSVPVPA
jgi:glutamine amidotransferase